MIITIDGPVASGKSSVAKRLADKLGFYYLYTGLLYRGLAYLLVTKFGYSDEELKKPRSADIDAIVNNPSFQYHYDTGIPTIMFNGENITPYLKTAEVDHWSSISSADPYVRQSVLHHQIELGKKYNLVVDGRDTGTIVFPHATIKIFLTAAPEVRAKRWQQDQMKAGKKFTFADALTAINERDQRDITRPHSPLIPATDAIIIDNSDMSIEETDEKLYQLCLSQHK
ncbi:MAG: (d)CMP kinase [Candidatus Babeliaceae bacterium]|nr:(d)CMP kinase [Candidatus Babeliaceae bacterium]